MNYALQVPNYDSARPLDYSRAALPSLHENALVESAGIGGPAGRSVVYSIPSGVARLTAANGPIDWNNDGDTNDTVSRNINDFCTFFLSATGETLNGANDWANLHYSFTTSPDFTPGSRFTTEALVDTEVKATDAVEVASNVDGDGDGVVNADDVCPSVADPAQLDTDHDGVGDACDIDAVAPVAAPTVSPAPNAAGWNRTNVTVTWHWTDEAGGSGLNTTLCRTSTVSSGEGAAVNVTATCSDRAGNQATAGRAVMVDKTKPVIVCPTAQKRVLNAAGSTLVATVTDAVSGVVSPTATVAAPTGVVGARSVTVSATDRAGNVATASCGYQVVYNVQWLLPVGGVGAPRSVNRNTVIPFTFRLVDANGNAVNAATAKAATSPRVTCPTGTLPFVASVPGNASTRKLGNGWWLTGWKATTAMRGTCQQVSIRLSDGTTITGIYKVV